MSRHLIAGALLGTVCVTGPAFGQAETAPAPSAPAVSGDTHPGTTASALQDLQANQSDRPGRFHLGPFYLTPLIRIGSLGLDTNVFYTQTDRRADVSGSGGPGLRVVVPLGGAFRLASEGGANYLYFVRTPSQRRFTADGWAGLEAAGARTSGSLIGSYVDTFGRPSFEIDQRIEQRTKGVTAHLSRQLAGRTSLDLRGEARREETPGGQDVFLGTDLQRTLTRDLVSGAAALEYALTPKTRFVVEGAYEQNRFPFDHTRDGITPRADAGLRTDETALIAGHALAGARWFRPDDRSLGTLRGLYVDVDAVWHITARTRLGGGYARDLAYTSFVAADGAPITRNETVSALLEREIFHNVLLRGTGRRVRSRTESSVVLTLASGETTTLVRDDTYYEATGDLAYRVAARLWIGGTAGYAERQSTISDFGVKGLLVGGKVIFTP